MNYFHICSNCIEARLGPLYFDSFNTDEHGFGETNVYLDLLGLGLFRLSFGPEFIFKRIPA